LGAFLTHHQEPTFQPFFRIQEKSREIKALNKVITPDIVQGMITMAKFEMDTIEVYVSDKLGATTIALGLRGDNGKKEDIHPISGFPRCLVTDILPRGMNSTVIIFLIYSHHSAVPTSTDAIISSAPTKRKSHRRARTATTNIDEQQILSPSSENLSHSRGNSSSSSIPQFPDSAEVVSSWVARRAAVQHHSESRGHFHLESSTSPVQVAPLHAAPLVPVSYPHNVVELPGNNTWADGEQPVQEEVDQDSTDLAEAISRSLIEQTNNRFTIGGTDMVQLAQALERSRFEM
jgi:hypothetical protein